MFISFIGIINGLGVYLCYVIGAQNIGSTEHLEFLIDVVSFRVGKWPVGIGFVYNTLIQHDLKRTFS